MVPPERRELVMGRSVLHWVCACALVALPVGGCSDETASGAGGMGGNGGVGGVRGVGGGGGDSGGMPECETVDDCLDDFNECTANACTDDMCTHPMLGDGTACDEDNECTTDGACAEGDCLATPVADETPCGDGAGTCEAGSCVGTFPCSEQGIRDAISVGGGPHAFDCDGPTAITLGARIIIDNDVMLNGEGNLILGGNGIDVTEGVTAALSGATIGGRADSIINFGALTLANVVLTPIASTSRQSTITDSTVPTKDHTTIVVNTSGRLTITDSTVSNNYAGPAIFAVFAPGDLTITDSTVSNNNSNAFLVLGEITVIRTTIADNRGWGIWGAGGGTALVRESTFSGNDIVLGVDDSLTLINSTVSGRVDGNVKILSSTIGMVGDGPATVRGSLVWSCAAEVSSLGYNINIGNDFCGFDQPTDQVDVDADEVKLLRLADNGGRTQTRALGEGSVAIDLIPEADCVVADGEPLTTDQRGEPRPGGTMCDVGAFEVQP